MRSTLRIPLGLGLVAAAVIGACGGGGSSAEPTPTPTPTPDTAISITSAASSADSRLPCYKGTPTAECGLRMYQIMVESFIDGDASANFNVGYGTSHHKGDLQGIINSLDYIKGTGVNAIWLTPIFESAPVTGQDQWADKLDATGYFASNYFKIDARFGTLAQAQTLVDEAHKRGLYVFLDGVFGHHKSNIVASPNGNLPTGANDPVTYPGSFAFYKEVATYWIKTLKIDGWRLDQAYQVPTAQWAALRDAVKQASSEVTYTDVNNKTVNPLGYMVAEIWQGESQIASSGYGTSSVPALNSAFDFPGRYRVVQTLATQEDTSSSNAKGQPATTLGGVYSTHSVYPDHAIPNLMLGNHDLVRFGDLIQRAGYGGPETDGYWQRHKLAFSFMAAYSGPVTLYYGDEIGQEVANFAARVSDCGAIGLCDDHVARSSGIVSGLNARQTDLKAYVAKLWNLRDSHPALAVGSRTHVYSDSVLYLDRKDAGSDHVLLAMNIGSTAKTVKINTSVLNNATALTDLQSGASLAAANAVIEVTIPPLSSRLLGF